MLIIPKPKRIEILCTDASDLNVPFYDKENLPEGYCARYTRFCADFIFNLKFPSVNAWALREHKKIRTINPEILHLPYFVRPTFMKPGMLIGVYYPKSKHNEEGRKYTHVALYLGQRFGEPLFVEQFGDDVRTMSLRDYEKRNMKIIEVLALKN